MKRPAPPIGKNKKTNVFGDDDDDDDSSDNGGQAGDARKNFNKQLGKVQAALRQRAQAIFENNPYEEYEQDYSNENPTNASIPSNKETKSQTQPPPERKSRYIADLLATANQRRRQRETILERKIVKQQALEDAEEDFAGKEKFITKAYRQKLEERKQWEAEEAERQRDEDANDVTKLTTAGAAMASFYGNISKNVAMGGGHDPTGETATTLKTTGRIRHDSEDEDAVSNKGGGGDMGFLSGFERSGEEPTETVTQSEVENHGQGVPDETKPNGPIEPELTARERRERKVAEARIRYLQRKGLALEQ